MNDKPTPETDAFIGEQDGVYMTDGEIAMCDFARKLERERDEDRDTAVAIIDASAQNIAELNQRLIERTADMLAKIVEVERTARLWEKRYNEQIATLVSTAQERDEKDAENQAIRLAIKEASEAFDECGFRAEKIQQIKWGNDGDCGATSDASIIEETAAKALAKLKPFLP